MRWSLLLLAFMAPSATADDQWGHLKMRFVYDGEPPKPPPLELKSDGKFCGEKNLVDESLLVDPADRGLANVLIWLLNTDAILPIHPSYNAAAREPATLISRNCRYEPRVVVVQRGQPFVWTNGDHFGHGMHADFWRNQLIEQVLPKEKSLEWRFEAAEERPTPLVCGIHPHMRSFLFITDTPYAAVSDKHGRLSMSNVPTGKRTFIVWHEKLAQRSTGVRGGASIEWSGGRLTMEIKPGDNDLGEIKLPAEQFGRKPAF